MAVYVKALFRRGGIALHPAGSVHYGEGPYVTFTPPAGEPGPEPGSFFRGDVHALYIMSEAGKTLDKIRGMTDGEAGERDWTHEQWDENRATREGSPPDEAGYDPRADPSTRPGPDPLPAGNGVTRVDYKARIQSGP